MASDEPTSDQSLDKQPKRLNAVQVQRVHAAAYSICQKRPTFAHRQTAILKYAAIEQRKHGDDYGNQVYNIAWATLQTYQMKGSAPPPTSGKKKLLVVLGATVVTIIGTVLAAIVVNWINGGGSGGGAGTP